MASKMVAVIRRYAVKNQPETSGLNREEPERKAQELGISDARNLSDDELREEVEQKQTQNQ